MRRSTVQSRKRHGRHYTPGDLAAFLADLSLTHLPAGRPLRILDPACGDGELLVAVANALNAENTVRYELVGFDLDDAALIEASRRLAQLKAPAELSAGDFLHILDNEEGLGHFDLVITNPPYVRTQVLGSEASRKLAARYGLSGRVDLTHAFVAVAADLLSPAGILALLCSNRFLSTKAGANVRRILDESFSVHELYDLGDTKLFEAAVLPAIVIASKGRRRASSPPPRFVRVYECLNSVPAVPTRPGIIETLKHPAQGQVAVG